MTTEFVASIEGAEAEAMLAYESSSSPDLRDRLGLAAARIGGGVVLSVRHDPAGYWSKALGFGFTEPVTRDLVDRIIGFYRSEGTPSAVIQIAPAVLPDDWEEIRTAYGLEPMSSWIKLAAPVEAVRPAGGTRLRVAPVDAADFDEWAQVLLRGFGMPADGLDQMISGAVRNPAFRPYGVWDGPELVGVGNVYFHGSVAALSAGTVLPDHRNQGAQSALITARAEAARAAGCRWLVAETGQPAPGERNPSMDNLVRAGLTVRYARQNWRWRA
ncbi:hypothetical protein Ais01nite_40350 [Asanoa ishikariensis]|uniref:N-acetyltransferase domain-containing protein n=1 Tax=Asanoa ishikariensis TaxID=137265 RepID=A0A1H3MBJ8_9ACTN|nr:GNAT family N-acetyltransferase [Asanoa ishikariensis]GIF66000.1 hypothetical protein Ais01nite_40350 [Asanoa ishikariensis]SDY73385.1 hypothetical protein SAMN05421684_1271 [Asanoa ishikariensis]